MTSSYYPWLVATVLTASATALPFVSAGCGGDDNEVSTARDAAADADIPCDPDAQTGCGEGLACETIEGGKPACFAPVELRGRVVRARELQTGIGGARIVARTVNQQVVSRGVATSNADGSYALRIAAPRRADGTPKLEPLTLRADADGYVTFPGGLRIALPIDVSSPSEQDAGYLVENAQTTLALDDLPAGEARGTIRGVVHAERPAGTLVVAGARTGIADTDGSYVVFNAAAGDVEVRGYGLGTSFAGVRAVVPARGEIAGIDLYAGDAGLAAVTGSLQFVNAGAVGSTSIVLAVAGTYSDTLGRGEVPPGLRLAGITGDYRFPAVPAGDYVVLAAFENDLLVRDPDTSIGGTETQRITVGGAGVAVPGFKITGALAVRSPGANNPEPITGTPTFVWADDSSEDGYEVFVFDTFGNEIWSDKNVPSVSGNADVSLAYGGPALQPGYHQFRAYSFRDKNGGRTRISATEDLTGVFIVP